MVKTHRETIIKKINKLEEFFNTSTAEIEQKAIEIAEECQKENEEKECEDNDKIHSEKPLPTQSAVVEEIPGECKSREENNLCGNTIPGV